MTPKQEQVFKRGMNWFIFLWDICSEPDIRTGVLAGNHPSPTSPTWKMWRHALTRDTIQTKRLGTGTYQFHLGRPRRNGIMPLHTHLKIFKRSFLKLSVSLSACISLRPSLASALSSVFHVTTEDTESKSAEFKICIVTQRSQRRSLS